MGGPDDLTDTVASSLSGSLGPLHARNAGIRLQSKKDLQP
jgi:hypothetical protein